MIDYEYRDLFDQSSVDKQIFITSDDDTVNITNSNIENNTFSLKESLNSAESLIFGSCEASVLKFTARNVNVDLTGKWLTVKSVLDGHTDNKFQYGRYKVKESVPNIDRTKRDVTCYDAMTDILKADVTDWYNNFYPNSDTTHTLRELRDSFFAFCHIEQEEVTLVNDDEIIEKTIDVTQISGGYIIVRICEANGCFGHINRQGKFEYVFLQDYTTALYPRNDLYPSDDLFPSDDSKNIEKVYKSKYKRGTCDYADYDCEKITGLVIRKDSADVGVTVGTNDNLYAIEDNFLFYGKEIEDLERIGNKILGIISRVKYTPFSLSKRGNPCMEVGQPIKVYGNNKMIYSYVLERELTGSQQLNDVITAQGTEYVPADVNSPFDEIKQLKGKANRLERDLDHTKSEIVNLDEGLRSEIEQTASSITSTVARNTKNYDTTGYEIKYYGYGIPSIDDYEDKELNDYYLDQSTGKLYQYKSRVTPGMSRYYWSEIKTLPTILEASDSKIEQTVDRIDMEVKKAEKSWDYENYNIIQFENTDPYDGQNAKSMFTPYYYLNMETGGLYKITSVSISGNVDSQGNYTSQTEISAFEFIKNLNNKYLDKIAKVEINLDSITSTVAESMQTYIWDGYTTDNVKGFGHPDNWKFETEPIPGITAYLDQTNGNMYILGKSQENGKYPWEFYGTAQTQLQYTSSQIAQMKDQILLQVSKDLNVWDKKNYDVKVYKQEAPYVSMNLTTEHIDRNSTFYYVNVADGKLYSVTVDNYRRVTSFDYIEQLKHIDLGSISEIKITIDGITQTVAGAQRTYDTTGYTISFTDFGSPIAKRIEADEAGQYYLDQTNGQLWISTNSGVAWNNTGRTLRLVTAKLQSLIEQTAESITQTVSRDYETKTDASLKKTSLESQIEQTAESITSTVARNIKEWNTSGYTIAVAGYGNSLITTERYNLNDLYLDQETGYIYKITGVVLYEDDRNGYSLQKIAEATLIAEDLSSQISQTANSIILSVDDSNKGSASITIAITDATTGETKTVTKSISLDADTINLSASDIINMMSGGTINLSAGKGIAIQSPNFSVDKSGNVKIKGEVEATSAKLSDYIYMWLPPKFGFSGEYTGIMKLERFSPQGMMGTQVGLMIGGNNVPTIAFKNVPEIAPNGLSESTNNLLYSDYTISSMRFISNAGVIGASPYIEVSTGSGAYGISVWASDTKLKKNIEKTEQTALDKVNAIDFIQFDWKQDKSHVDLGVSANQIQEIIPEAVYEVEQSEDSEFDSLKNIDGNVLTTYALKAIQEQQEIIDRQQAEIDELKETVRLLCEKVGVE